MDLVFNYIYKIERISKAYFYYSIKYAYNRRMLKNKRQGYIINGVSGPGKTESTKIILEYCNNFNNDEISKIILDRIPVLEVFGNAKLIRNENSSKFSEINN